MKYGAKFSKDDALRYLKQVNKYFGFKEPTVAKGVLEAVDRIGCLDFTPNIPRSKVVESLSVLQKCTDEVVNILWLNGSLNHNLHCIVPFDSFGTLTSRKQVLPSFLAAEKSRASLNSERKRDMLEAYNFIYDNLKDTPIKIGGKGKYLTLQNTKGWFTDMLRKAISDTLPEIISTEQAREQLIKKKGRPADTLVNTAIWGTFRLLVDYGIIRDQVTKSYLSFVCDYLDIIDYPDKTSKEQRFADIRATISQMKKGKMNRPHFKRIEI